MKLTAISFLLKAAIVICPMTASAADVPVLHNFGTSIRDGELPFYGSLILDKSGNLYGTTTIGGTTNGGTVFELSPAGNGHWTAKTLHAFGALGSNPEGGLVFDATGNLYGSTLDRGAHKWGSVFELSPVGDGTWTEKVLFDFPKGQGIGSACTLVFDAVGNLYGTTTTGGANGLGAVFELSPAEGGGQWTQTVLYSFAGTTDGEYPYAGVVFDAAGNLYGTAPGVNPNGSGTVFELTPGADGWTETTLATFVRANTKDGGWYPRFGVILDKAGNLYGTLQQGGTYNGGAVFELVRAGDGVWTKKILHNFDYSPTGGRNPYAGVILDNSGNLFGTTAYGGAHGAGEIFELSPDGSGGWTPAALHSFDNADHPRPSNGALPEASLVIDEAGNLYGTTNQGGTHNAGVAFELIR